MAQRALLRSASSRYARCDPHSGKRASSHSSDAQRLVRIVGPVSIQIKHRLVHQFISLPPVRPVVATHFRASVRRWARTGRKCGSGRIERRCFWQLRRMPAAGMPLARAAVRSRAIPSSRSGTKAVDAPHRRRSASVEATANESCLKTPAGADALLNSRNTPARR